MNRAFKSLNRFASLPSQIRRTMSSNNAAYLVSEKARPFEVREAPFPKAGPKQLVIRARAIAINPLDGMLQKLAFLPLQYPKILGEDAAGEVVEVGEGVTRFKVGDRVLSLPLGTFASDDQSGFQEYIAISEHVTSPIPSGMSYEQAVALPLSVSTAASGMFQKDYLGLQLPSANPKPTGETLFVYGASTSTGLQAVQLAKAAGYEVVATAGAKNMELVKSLGASQVFEYKSPTVAADAIAALKGKHVAGAVDCIGFHGAGELTSEVLAACTGKKFIAATQNPATAYAEGVEGKMIFGSTLAGNEVGPAVWEGFLPQALSEGRYIAVPAPHVVGKGLDKIQEAVDAQPNVSAKKVVVSL